MLKISAGTIVTKDDEKVGEYWTAENDFNVVCVKFFDKLLTIDKAYFSDWLQLTHVYSKEYTPQCLPSCFDVD